MGEATDNLIVQFENSTTFTNGYNNREKRLISK